MLAVERAGHLQALAAGGRAQLLERLGVLIYHHLRELLHLRILRLLQGELAQLNLGHVRHGGLLNELLQVVAVAAALSAGRGGGARLPARSALVTDPARAGRRSARAASLAAALRPARAGALRRNRWDTCRRRPHERRTRGRDYLYSSHGSLLTRGGYTRLSACGNRRRRLTMCNLHALNRLERAAVFVRLSRRGLL